MLPDSLTVQSVLLTKRSEQNGVTTYTGTHSWGSGSNYADHIFEVKHTRNLGKGVGKTPSSLLKYTRHFYDVDGVFDFTDRCWLVVESERLAQDGVSNLGFLVGVYEAPTFQDQFIGGSF